MKSSLLIIDFESLMFELLGEKSPDDLVEDTDEKTKGVADKSNARTLLAEDSPIIRQGVEKLLRSRGFENLVVCSDGVKVWAAIEASRNNGGPLFDLILTDIEMPGLDGLHLTTRIRKEERLRNTKVVLFSSIVNPKNDNKGNSVDADAQVAKNSDRLILETIKVC
jgi:two-component system chemotaxis response regulator CheV